MSANRIMRISEEVRKEVSEIIQNGLKDPRISGMISVTKVAVTNDLRYAKVYVSVLGDDEDRKHVMLGLKNAAGYIRKEVGQRINMRYTPEMLFEIDDSIEYGIKISNILKNILPQKEE